MLRDRTARRHTLIFGMLVGLSLLLLASAESRPLRDLRSGVNSALAPVQRALSGLALSAGGVLLVFADIEQLRSENHALSQQTAELDQVSLQIKDMASENRRLTGLLDMEPTFGHIGLSAAVIYSDPTRAERVITLDRGSDDGVARDAAVVSLGGALVGQVKEVGPNYSAVRLLSDTRSALLARVVRTRVTGALRGNLTAPLELDDVRASDDIAVGDIVVTAGSAERGLESQFPSGIIIGTIIEVAQGPASVVRTARVQAAANLESLQTVVVLTGYVPPTLPSGPRLPAAH